MKVFFPCWTWKIGADTFCTVVDGLQSVTMCVLNAPQCNVNVCVHDNKMVRVWRYKERN